jgi:CRP-like cAMP-binding protein
MTSRKWRSTHNRLLAALSDDDYALLQPHLVQVDLVREQVLIEPGEEIQHCWFIEAGIASVIAGSVRGDQVEIGIIGWEGMVDVAVIHDLNRSMLRCMVQAAGSAYRIGTLAMQEALQRSPSLRVVLLHYAHTFLLQVSSTTLANASFSVEERIARWLLMYHDRTTGDALALTHELLALMLNVRRAGVTLALQAMNTANIITARRGLIVISNRQALEQFAGEGYGAAEKLSALPPAGG